MIREMKLEDFDSVNVIFNEVHKLHVDNTDFFLDVDVCPIEEFKNIISNEQAINLVFEENGKILGFLISEIEDRESRIVKRFKTLHVSTLGVLNGEHKKGIGKSLLLEAKSRAKKEKVTRIALSVWMFNKNAFDFYKHLGFEDMNLKMFLEIE